jgi:hypothetical protein
VVPGSQSSKSVLEVESMWTPGSVSGFDSMRLLFAAFAPLTSGDVFKTAVIDFEDLNCLSK